MDNGSSRVITQALAKWNDGDESALRSVLPGQEGKPLGQRVLLAAKVYVRVDSGGLATGGSMQGFCLKSGFNVPDAGGKLRC